VSEGTLDLVPDAGEFNDSIVIVAPQSQIHAYVHLFVVELDVMRLPLTR
jgi:hypothetical protein